MLKIIDALMEDMIVPAPAKAKRRTRRIDYSDPRWQIIEVHSKFHPPVRVPAVSVKQTKYRAKEELKKKGRLGSTGWLEVTELFVVQIYRVTYKIGGAIIETVASDINETDARFYLAKRLVSLTPRLPTVISVEQLSTLWEYNRTKGRDPESLYAPGEEPNSPEKAQVAS